MAGLRPLHTMCESHRACAPASLGTVGSSSSLLLSPPSLPEGRDKNSGRLEPVQSFLGARERRGGTHAARLIHHSIACAWASCSVGSGAQVRRRHSAHRGRRLLLTGFLHAAPLGIVGRRAALGSALPSPLLRPTASSSASSAASTPVSTPKITAASSATPAASTTATEAHGGALCRAK